MLEKIKNWALGLFVACLFSLSVVGALGSCNRPVASANSKRIDTIVQVRHDTLFRLDSVLKTRIKYIETVRIDTVHDILDSLIPIDSSDNDGNQVISENQLREAVKWHDSLSTCKEMRRIDSVAIDTLSKLGKEKASPTIIDDAKKVGLGIMLGIGIRSLF